MDSKEMTLALHYRGHPQFLATGEYLERAAKRLGITIDDDSPVVLNIESGNPYFRKGKVVTAVYDIDVFQNKDNPTTQMLEASDVYFATHEPDRCLEKFVHIPHGFDPELCVRSWKKYDVALSGRISGGEYGLRQAINHIIRENFSYTEIEYGTPTPEYLKELSRAKIILNVAGWKEMNRRVFDGMAMGVPLLNASPHAHMLGEKGVHYHTFENGNDIIKVVKRILKNYPKYRRASRKHAYENHTYDVRLQKIYDTLKEVYDAKIHKSAS